MMPRKLGTKTRTKKKMFTGRGLSSLDLEIVQFIWRWKFAPASVLHLALAWYVKPRAFNKRLSKLETHGWIEAFSLPRERWIAWKLGEQAESCIHELIDNIQETGSGSASPLHDRLVLAFSMGEWIYDLEKTTEYFTEQMITRLDPELRPDWIMPFVNERIPDCIIKSSSPDGQRVFAFEVELHAKAQVKYEWIIRAYKSTQELSRVIWLYRDPFIVDQIQKAIKTVRCDSTNYIVFVDEKDFLQNMWNAKVTNERSEDIGTLRKILRGEDGVTPRQILVTTGVQHQITDYLRSQKFLKVSNGLASSEEIEKSLTYTPLSNKLNESAEEILCEKPGVQIISP